MDFFKAFNFFRFLERYNGKGEYKHVASIVTISFSIPVNVEPKIICIQKETFPENFSHFGGVRKQTNIRRDGQRLTDILLL